MPEFQVYSLLGIHMKHLRNVLMLFLSLQSVSALAAQQTCAELLALKPNEDVSRCECGKVLSNVEIAAPKGMRLAAICGLVAIEYRPDLHYRAIDLSKERISPDKRVDYFGRFIFSGTVVVSGEVRYDPASDVADMFFVPQPSLAPYESRFSGYYAELDLHSHLYGKQFNLPENEDPHIATCKRATAKIKLRGIEVDLWETHERLDPIGLEVLSKSDFAKVKCLRTQ